MGFEIAEKWTLVEGAVLADVIKFRDWFLIENIMGSSGKRRIKDFSN